MCVCAFVGHGFLGLHCRMPHAFPTFSRTYISGHACLTANKIWVFHPGGGSTPTCSAQHTFHFHFQNHVTHSGRCPMLPSPPSNTKHSVDQPCTYDIPSNTKHSVDLYHALTPMSCDVLVHNAMQSCHCLSIPCYTYNECYMCI